MTVNKKEFLKYLRDNDCQLAGKFDSPVRINGAIDKQYSNTTFFFNYDKMEIANRAYDAKTKEFIYTVLDAGQMWSRILFDTLDKESFNVDKIPH